jgi:hypothetical protein
MALALLDWLRWGWGCFVIGGIWKQSPKPLKTEPKPKDNPGNF